MQIHELTTASNVESTDYVAVDNGTATRKYNLGTALQYKAGDSLSGSFFVFGVCTSTARELRVMIPVSKYIKSDITIVPNISTLQIRGMKSDMSGYGYAGGSTDFPVPSTATQSMYNASFNKQGVLISITLPSGETWGLINNTPVVGFMNGTIAFT